MATMHEVSHMMLQYALKHYFPSYVGVIHVLICFWVYTLQSLLEEVITDLGKGLSSSLQRYIIPCGELELGKVIGNGHLGVVYKGTFKKRDVAVAVRLLKGNFHHHSFRQTDIWYHQGVYYWDLHSQ